jgi:hypothetical protein
VRNSSLVKWFCAENVTGLKSVTEASDCQVFHLGITIFAAVRPPNVTFQRELGQRSWTSQREPGRNYPANWTQSAGKRNTEVKCLAVVGERTKGIEAIP